MKRHRTKVSLLVAGVAGMLLLGACATSPRSREGKVEIERDADATIAKARRSDSSLVQVLDRAAGYAVFPSVGKGAVGVGGAYGKGVLYDRGVAVGYCDLSQASIGLQLGGQSYAEIIAFETKDAMRRFKEGTLAFDAQVSAVALKSGAGANAKFANGVAVFTMDEAGLMYEASVGGQKFAYEAK
jgi:lipid-binding SYLF domain-containing protein